MRSQLLVRVQVVQDDVNLPVFGLLGNDIVHENLKVRALFRLRGLAPDDAGGNPQRRKQVHRPVAFAGTLDAARLRGNDGLKCIN